LAPWLAFVAPDIVKGAIGGRPPRGFAVKRLIELPMAWPPAMAGARACGPGLTKLIELKASTSSTPHARRVNFIDRNAPVRSAAMR
jgi:hypothetical protein